ncbi:hypothetical protein M3J09_004187 [Ascochyta lentis]
MNREHVLAGATSGDGKEEVAGGGATSGAQATFIKNLRSVVEFEVHGQQFGKGS